VGDVLKESEMMLICRQCGKEFVFSKSEQEFYKLKGFVLPLHCKACRIARKNLTSQICSSCGLEIPKGGPLYCSCCSNAVQLGYELEFKKMQKDFGESRAKILSLESEKARLAEEIQAKLPATESEKARLCELLQQKELAIAELELQIDKTSLELDKSLKFHAAIEYLQPTLLEFKETLKAIEHTQVDLSNRIFQLAQKMEEPHENAGIMESIGRLFRQHRRSPSETNH
jgi:hypothetical protein